jgi:hypothetical protein
LGRAGCALGSPIPIGLLFYEVAAATIVGWSGGRDLSSGPLAPETTAFFHRKLSYFEMPAIPEPPEGCGTPLSLGASDRLGCSSTAPSGEPIPQDSGAGGETALESLTRVYLLYTCNRTERKQDWAVGG